MSSARAGIALDDRLRAAHGAEAGFSLPARSPALADNPDIPAAAREAPVWAGRSATFRLHGTALQPDTPLDDNDLERLGELLDALPAPLEPLDVSALDGYLCGVLLQPRAVPAAQWQAHVADIEGRPAPAGPALDELLALVHRRHAELDHAIGQREWFDPWIFPLDGEATANECVLPWVAGFAAAMDHFPALMAVDDPELVEPLALLYLHFDPADLEDADALAAVIETLEPPADLAEAVQDIVRAVMLMADVTRPRPAPRTTPRPSSRRPAPRRPRR